MISPREVLLAFLLPALLCVLLGALAARIREGAPRRLVQALAVALPYSTAFWGISGYVPLLDPLANATQLVPLLALVVALACTFLPAGAVLLAAPLLLWLLFSRLSAPPPWTERLAAVLAFAGVWWASRGLDSARPASKPLLVLGTFALAVACVCFCGRVASLALIAGGLGASLGAGALAVRWAPSWSLGRPGVDVAIFALGGTLACAHFLGNLNSAAALVLLAALLATRIPAFGIAFATQLAASALALWLAWPTDGFAV